MTESEIWKRAINFIEESDFTVICGCPPGATSYMYKNCLLNLNNQIDAPDIIFLNDNILYFCECKPTLKELYKTNLNNENDLDKLNRIITSTKAGNYDKQLIQNFNIKLGNVKEFRPCVIYSGSEKKAELEGDFSQLIVNTHGTFFYK